MPFSSCELPHSRHKMGQGRGSFGMFRLSSYARFFGARARKDSNKRFGFQLRYFLKCGPHTRSDLKQFAHLNQSEKAVLRINITAC